MFTLLLSAAVFSAAPEDKPAAAISLDGTWVVLCAEKDGKPMPEAKNMTVTAKGDTITCSGKDGKAAMTMKVAFGPNGTLKVTETTSAASDKPSEKMGVYVLTQDYFSICVHDASDKEADAKPTNKCTFVLSREGAKPAPAPGR